MKTKEFLALLEAHPTKVLSFNFSGIKEISHPYHITEVKNVWIDSVDCGGRSLEERQTVVQLWIDPKEKSKEKLTSQKAKSIMDIVDKKKPLHLEIPIFFEFGDEELPTSTYVVKEIQIEEDKVLLNLEVPPTMCKPKMLLNSALSCCEVKSCCTTGA